MINEEKLEDSIFKEFANKTIEEFKRYCILLNEFYDSTEINDFCLDVTELAEDDVVIKCFEHYGIEFPSDLAGLVLIPRILEKFKKAYEKNREAVKYGFSHVKIPLEQVTTEELVKETKKLTERLSEFL